MNLIPPFVWPGGPAPSVQPFTFKDGLTYLQRLERIVKYIDRVIVPFVNNNYTELAESFTEVANNLVEHVNLAIQSVIDSSIELQDPVLFAIVEDVESLSRQALDLIYASEGDFQQLAEDFTTFVNTTTNNVEALQTLTETGRLSEAELDTTIENTISYQLARTTAPVRVVQDGVDGVVGGSSVDNRAAIQAIIDEAGRGATIVFDNPGTSRIFRIDNTLHLNEGQQRLKGPGDLYDLALWTNVPGITMIESRSAGTILDGMSLMADFTRAVTTVTGIEFFGSVNADVDARVVNSIFYQLASSIEVRGKNLKIKDTLFSNSKNGVQVLGQDVGYHTSWDSRGLVIDGGRFHGMGESTSDAAIRVGTATPHRNSMFINSFFDMFGNGRHISVEGISGANPHQNLLINGNLHTDVNGPAIYLENISRSRLSNTHIRGVGGSNPTGRAIHLKGGNTMIINDVDVISHNTGMMIESSTHTDLANLNMNANLTHGFEFGAGVSRIKLAGLVAFVNSGWGMTGSAALSNVYGGTPDAIYSNVTGQIDPVLGLA